MKADKGKKYAKGGSFAGKETAAEETKEANALKSGKISKAAYVRGEKSEGESPAKAKQNANTLKSGKLSAKAYAASEKRFASGGQVKPTQKTADDDQPTAKEKAAMQDQYNEKKMQDNLDRAGKKYMGFAKGGSVDGCATRGKTKGRFI